MLIKSRPAKLSKRGIYLQDRQLRETVFQPGTSFSYIIDVAQRQVVIVPAIEGGNTVSKRDRVKPVLDIRSKQALSAFAGCDYLQVDIYGEQIIISGYEEQAETLHSKAKRLVRQTFKGERKVRDITELLQVKKKAQVVLSRRDLAAAAGFEQIAFNFAEVEDSFTAASDRSSVRYIEQALRNLQIPLQVDSMFSGAGLLDLGFIEQGFELVYAIEKDADAVRTYRANLGGHIEEGDITQVPRSRFSSPVMIGGSPCQGFSNSNRHSHFLDNPNNRLVRAYIDAVKSNPNCQVFVLENVPQILTAGNGQFRDEILEELSEFEVSFGKLNAADYGAPQARERACFIGSKIGRIDLPAPTHAGRHVSVRQALGGLSPFTPNQLDVSKHKPITLECIKSVPPGGNVFDIPEAIRPAGQHSDQYKRLLWDAPAVTIVNPRKAMLLHPEEDRTLSVRECARLQGVPDSFSFEGSLAARQQQVANGVPVQLTKAIAGVIRAAILKLNLRGRLQPSF